ncbi:hypothetical protein OROGR_012829 [Orobanche gracilis]
MKTDQPKVKPLFSCGFFRQCTQTVLSPTSPAPPPLPPAAPTPRPPTSSHLESSSSSSSNTSQSFTQWRFPLSNSTISHHSYSQPQSEPVPEPEPRPNPPLTDAGLEDVFRLAESQFSSGTETGRFGAGHLLERSLVPNPHSAGDGDACPSAVMGGVVECLREGVARKASSKVLLVEIGIYK